MMAVRKSSGKLSLTAPHRLTVRLDDKTMEQVKYWADKKGCSTNDFVIDSIIANIARLNGDFTDPAPLLVVMNQLVDRVGALDSDISSLRSITTSGFDSVIGLARGDNYLSDDNDGEL